MWDISTLSAVAGVVLVPVGAFVKKVYANETRLTVLEANYLNLDRKMSDIMVTAHNTNEKLDRLVERFL